MRFNGYAIVSALVDEVHQTGIVDAHGVFKHPSLASNHPHKLGGISPNPSVLCIQFDPKDYSVGVALLHLFLSTRSVPSMILNPPERWLLDVEVLYAHITYVPENKRLQYCSKLMKNIFIHQGCLPLDALPQSRPLQPNTIYL